MRQRTRAFGRAATSLITGRRGGHRTTRRASREGRGARGRVGLGPRGVRRLCPLGVSLRATLSVSPIRLPTVRAGLREICVGFCSFCHVFDGPWRRTMACLAAPARRTGHLSPSLPRGTGTIWGRPQHICAPPPHVSAVIPHSRLLVDSRCLQVRAALRRNVLLKSAPVAG